MEKKNWNSARLMLLLAATIVFLQAHGAPGSYFGVRTGMDVTFPSGSEGRYKTGAGFHAGGVYHFSFTRKFFFEPGLMFFYHSMSSDLPENSNGLLYNTTATYTGLRLPLYAGYSFNPSENLEIGVATGPALAFNLSARQKIEADPALPIEVPAKSLNLFDYGTKRVDALWGIRLNFTFAKSYFVGVEGEVSFTPLAVYGNRDKKIRIHRNAFCLSIGYNF